MRNFPETATQKKMGYEFRILEFQWGDTVVNWEEKEGEGEEKGTEREMEKIDKQTKINIKITKFSSHWKNGTSFMPYHLPVSQLTAKQA